MENCKHEWQCYGVAETFDAEADAGGQVRTSTISHFRSCGICGRVEELLLSEEEPK